MKEKISITLIIAFACGLILASSSHSISVFAQTNTTKQNTTASIRNKCNQRLPAPSAGNSTAQQQPSGNKSGLAATSGQSQYLPATTTTVKGGPKATKTLVN